MKRSMPDARHVVPAALPPASAVSTASQSTVSRLLSSGACHRINLQELLRSNPASSDVSNSVKEASSASAIATSFWPNVLPRWLPSAVTPTYLAAIPHQSPPVEFFLPTSAAGSKSISVLHAEAVDSEESSHFCHFNNSSSKTATVSKATEKLVQSFAADNDNNDDTSPTIASSPSVALPLPTTHSMENSSPSLAVITNFISAPTKKRKRIPGAMRMRNFLCMHPGCGKSFTDSAHLRDHTVVHTGEKKLSCPTCHKHFARASTLQEHVRTHTGEKPYVCDVLGCSKRYSSRAAVRFHRSTHVSQTVVRAGHESTMPLQNSNAMQVQNENPIPFVCQECGKLFRVRKPFMAHLKVHSVHRTESEVYPPKTASPLRSTIHQPLDTEEETSTLQRQRNGIYVSNGNETLPSHESRSLYDTIQAQQDQIERLQAEVFRLRGQPNVLTETRRPNRVPQTVVSVVAAVTAPVELLRDGVKPFECCICHNRFANFYQLTFHGKQHPERSINEVIGGQTPLPVGPKHCPEKHCEYAESTGRSLRNLQTLKRHWQRRHQIERPYACAYCPATRQKTFKTRENLKAHEKDCTKNMLVR